MVPGVCVPPRVRSSIGLATLASMVLLLLAACDAGETVLVDERYVVGDDAVAVIVAEDASLTVTQGSPGAVVVGGEFTLDRFTYVGGAQDGDVRIELRRERSILDVFGSREARLRIELPAGTALDVRGSNGPLTVHGDFAGGHVETSNGAIEVDGVSGELRAVTSNGDARVSGHRGALTVRSSNGAVVVGEHAGGSVSIETSNGPIDYLGTLAPASDNELVTSNGSITVELLGEPSLTLDARTSNGEVESRFALLDRSGGESRLTGRIGSGEGTLTLRTSNASIEVR